MILFGLLSFWGLLCILPEGSQTAQTFQGDTISDVLLLESILVIWGKLYKIWYFLMVSFLGFACLGDAFSLCESVTVQPFFCSFKNE